MSLFLIFGVSLAAIQAGCGSSGDGSTFTPNGGDSAPNVDPNGDFGQGGDGSSGGPGTDADPDALGTLVITPPNATIDATLVNGVLTAAPVTFSASYNGQTVSATWLFDRAELGDVSNAGVFTANGTNVGDGIVTARFGAREGNAKVKVNLKTTQNGKPAGYDPGGGTFGGLGGVGGENLGGNVAAPIEQRLKTETNPATDAGLKFLYPYDGTVWPRGLLPPLMMWDTTKTADAVYVKLSQGNYTFEGSYSMAGLTGAANKRVRLQADAWKAATGGNAGDDLQADVKIFSQADNKVYGPITLKWKVAPGVLKGTVYYNSYDSQITTGGGAETGGVIKIQPKSAEPSLAIPSMAGKCQVCHTVSADGSTLYVQDGKVTYPNGGDDYRNGASYDMTQANPTRITYAGATNAAQNRKFNWSAPYPDGSFALASSRFAREAYTQTDSKLFKRADGSEQTATGLTGVVTSAVSPAFSPDGRKVAFNFWQGTATNGVTPGDGRNLVMMDFSCGAAAGSTKCAAAGPFAFANIREVYNNPNTYPAWPSFLPDGKAIVFNNETARGNCGPNPPNPTDVNNCQISTWYNAKSELWIARDTSPATSRKLDAANGINLPTNADHPDDTQLNYVPTVNPVASGGYYWVVFTSRRIYGNVHTGKPWGADGQSGGPIKKLWVAAIDINAPAGNGDPSHPAFYLPGQELEAGNTRGFWVVDPCKQNGNSCESGDECCNGFCRKDSDGGALVCMDKPPGTPCSQEFEKCTVNADCCDPTQSCINGKCSRSQPPVN